MEVFDDCMEALPKYKEFFELMASRGYKKKVERMNQFQLDFGEEKYDDTLANAVKEFNERAESISKRMEQRLAKKRHIEQKNEENAKMKILKTSDSHNQI